MGKLKKASSSNLNTDQTNIILESLREGVCQISASGEISYSNRSAEMMLGRIKTDLIGKPYWEIFFGITREEHLANETFCPINFALESGENAHVSSEVFLRKDGSTVRTEYICVPLFVEQKVVGAVISFEDIGERYEAKKALETARDIAIEAAQAKSRFLANMSHEIRTPLNGIVGVTNLLVDSELSEEQRDYARMLESSAELLRSIVDDILDFSKIESGGFYIEEHRFSIKSLAEETIKFFTPLADDKKLSLECFVEGKISDSLAGDAGKIRQVLNNFISNALKFTGDGNVALTITLTADSDDSQEVKFAVSDTGIGISSDVQTKLFEPFVQGDISTTRIYGGTGLGLAISRQIIELMDGVIGLKSVPGEGSTFWFKMKFIKSAKAHSVPALSDEQKNALEGLKTPMPKFSDEISVLIVEDNPINCAVTLKMLEQMGISNIDTAEDGAVAIEKARRKSFDIVFMDCQMPILDGFESAAKIRDLDITQPKIVAVTASPPFGERDKYAASGMDGYLAKPFTKKELSKVLSEYFEPKTDHLNLDLRSDFVQHSLSKLIDSTKLENLLEIESNGREQFTKEILNLFLKHSQIMLEEMNRCAETKNYRKLAKTVHSFKGSSGNVGITRLFRLLAKLEERIEGNDHSAIDKTVEEINSEFENARSIILETL